MAEFYVMNSLNYKKAVKFNITLRYFVIKGEKGEHMWTLEIGTTHLDASGNKISPKRVHNISAINLDEVIEDATSELCTLIDWSPLLIDKWAPYISSNYPESGSTVPISANLYVTVEDKIPAAGIDLSNMKVYLNNGTTTFDITSEVETNGDPYKYDLKWIQTRRVYDTYD